MIRFDVTSAAFVADPYPVYARIRAENPVHFESGADAWFVTRYEHVASLLRDPRLRTAAKFPLALADAAPPLYQPLLGALRRMVVLLDPPDHASVRALFNRAFTPRAVRALDATIDDAVERLFDDFEGLGSVDLATAFAELVPLLVVSGAFGVEDTDRVGFVDWAKRLAALGDASRLADNLGAGLESGVHMLALLTPMLERRRLEPRGDLLSSLVAACDEHDELDFLDALATCLAVFAAGIITTAHLITNGVAILASNPAAVECLVGGDTAAVVDELLRFDSPTQFVSRVTAEPVEVGGVGIPAGAMVNLVLGAANRDPERFARPERFDPTRSDNVHLAFAGGAHACAGQALARAEGRIALRSLFARFPDLAVQSHRARRAPGFVFRGWESLPAVL